MKNVSVFAVLILGLVLAGCSDTDWENAMSFLPMERGSQATQTDEAPSSGAQPLSAAAYMPPASPAATVNRLESPAAAEGASEAATQHCRAIAKRRTSDGAYMGMDEDAQKQEYSLTYANCIAWETAHGG